MRVLISGYSPDTNMRCWAADAEGSVYVAVDAVQFPNGDHQAAVKILCDTQKTRNNDYENDVEIMFHDMTDDDAIHLASTLVEYACLRRFDDGQSGDAEALTNSVAHPRKAEACLKMALAAIQDFQSGPEHEQYDVAQKMGLDALHARLAANLEQLTEIIAQGAPTPPGPALRLVSSDGANPNNP